MEEILVARTPKLNLVICEQQANACCSLRFMKCFFRLSGIRQNGNTLTILLGFRDSCRLWTEEVRSLACGLKTVIYSMISRWRRHVAQGFWIRTCIALAKQSRMRFETRKVYLIETNIFSFSSVWLPVSVIYCSTIVRLQNRSPHSCILPYPEQPKLLRF